MAGDICPLRLDEDAYYDLNHLRTCTRRHIASQEHAMTSPTQRRHDEILGRLDALIDVVRSTTARDNLHRLLAEESAAERRDDPVEVTEEPTVGSQVTDVNGDVWHRRDDIVWRLVAYRDKSGSFGGAPWGHVRQFAPLRLTTDEDRERVGLPVDTAPDVDPDERIRVYVEMVERTKRAEADVERLTRERDEARSILPRLREALDGLRYYYTHHPAESVNATSVARRIQWRMEEVGILNRDDEQGRDA